MKATSHWELNCAESSVMSLVKALALKMAFVDALILQGGRRSSISSAQGVVVGKGVDLSSANAFRGRKSALKNCTTFVLSSSVKINFPSNAGFYGNFPVTQLECLSTVRMRYLCRVKWR